MTEVDEQDPMSVEVRVPVGGGIVSRVPANRLILATLGKMLAQLSGDPTRTGVLLILHDNGKISVSSKGIGGEGGRA